MKKLLKVILVILFVVGTGVCIITNPVLFAGNYKPVNAPADSTRLLADVKALCAINYRYNSDTGSLNKAAAYIKGEWEKLGLKVEEQKYTAEGKEYKNLICSFGPVDGERIIVGAHYDVCDEQPGADDNASGVAGLLELARLFKSQNQQLKYRVDFVAYTLEEPPHFRKETMGSAVHAKSLFDAKVNVKAMICLEMIGYFSDAPKSQEYPVGLLKLFYPGKANFIAVVGKFGQGKLVRKVKKNMAKSCKVNVRSINAPASVPGIDFSDHLNYWKYGYDAVMITDTSFYRNKNYHQKTDTPETLSYGKMAEVVKGVYNAIISL